MSTSIPRSPITTHVLDLTLGKAASGIEVILEGQPTGPDGSRWIEIARARTNPDGRIDDWGPALAPGSRAAAGIYRLSFNTEAYFQGGARQTFYPSVNILFRLERPEQHHHVPLLLSPYGYSTYRGT